MSKKQIDKAIPNVSTLARKVSVGIMIKQVIITAATATEIRMAMVREEKFMMLNRC
jgi:hypothetical protein